MGWGWQPPGEQPEHRSASTGANPPTRNRLLAGWPTFESTGMRSHPVCDAFNSACPPRTRRAQAIAFALSLCRELRPAGGRRHAQISQRWHSTWTPAAGCGSRSTTCSGPTVTGAGCCGAITGTQRVQSRISATATSTVADSPANISNEHRQPTARTLGSSDWPGSDWQHDA